MISINSATQVYVFIVDHILHNMRNTNFWILSCLSFHIRHPNQVIKQGKRPLAGGSDRPYPSPHGNNMSGLRVSSRRFDPTSFGSGRL